MAYEAQPRRIGTRGIIIRNGKLYCQQLKANNHAQTEPYWCTPGGGMDFGETVEQNLVREMVEETGVTPQVGRLLFVQQFHDGEKEQMEFFFHITNPDDYDEVDIDSTTHGAIEIERHGFVDPRTNNVLPAFLQGIDIQAFIDNNEPVLFYSQLS